MSDADKALLSDLLAPVDSIWVEGNHDQSFVPPGHSAVTEIEIGGIVLRHIMDEADGRPEISAHYHPAAVIHHRGSRVRRPCFVRAAGRLIIPAFGVLTGGLDCRDDALAALRGRDTQLFFWGRRTCSCRRPGLPPTTGGRAAASAVKNGLERVDGVAKLTRNRGIVRQPVQQRLPQCAGGVDITRQFGEMPPDIERFRPVRRQRSNPFQKAAGITGKAIFQPVHNDASSAASCAPASPGMASARPIIALVASSGLPSTS